MELKNELKELLYEMMLIEVFKTKEKNNKGFDDNYYGERVNTAAYNNYLFEKDNEEYALGLKFEELFLEHSGELTTKEMINFPNAAKVYANALLMDKGVSYPNCWSYEGNEVKYIDESELFMNHQKIVLQIHNLMRHEEIDEFEKKRLIKAGEFLHDCHYLLLNSKTKAKTRTREK